MDALVVRICLEQMTFWHLSSQRSSSPQFAVNRRTEWTPYEHAVHTTLTFHSLLIHTNHTHTASVHPPFTKFPIHLNGHKQDFVKGLHHRVYETEVSCTVQGHKALAGSLRVRRLQTLGTQILIFSCIEIFTERNISHG